ncbi:MAG: hypothetical protein ACUVXD_17110, partial [Thermodesulfobacteriota bacterium]
MKMDLRWRGIIILVVILLSFFFLGPSLTDSLPSFWKAHARKIPLGLDLRGGAHLLMRVKGEEAVRNSVTNMAAELQEAFVKEKIRFSKLDAKDRAVEVVLLKAEQEGELLNVVGKLHPELRRVSAHPEDGRLRVLLELSLEEAKRIQENA